MVERQGLRQISVRNFKRFDRFALSCRSANVLVGPNNAGKSSLLDALRILFGALRYAKRYRPQLIGAEGGEIWGYSIPDSSIPFDIANITANYSDDDAEIEFTHLNGTRLSILLHPSHLTRLHIPSASRVAASARTYFKSFPLEIAIVPTLSPLEQAENWVQDETIERNLVSRLGSRYFRNIWYRSTEDEFAEFEALVSATWDNARIKRPKRPPIAHSTLEMFFEERGSDRKRYDREISWSGFGFQVWLQILTHILRAGPESIFVLDEPDVYLHPDLQRFLLRIVRERFSQYFLATHSTEIINESDIGDVVIVKAENKAGHRVTSDEDYNAAFAYIGSLENVELAKLSRANRVIFFEGKDRKLLNKFTLKAGVPDTLGDSDTLVIAVGGFGQWKRVIEAAWTFKEVLQIQVRIFSLFDRDYRDPREVERMLNDVGDKGIRCAVWQRKEIENYALVPESLSRLIIKRGGVRGHNISETEAAALVEEVSELHKHEVYGNILKHRLVSEKEAKSGLDNSTVATRWMKEFDAKWKSIDYRLRLLPGKQFIADLSTRMQESYGCSVSISMLIEELRPSEIDPEMVEVLEEIARFCTDADG